jgi:uncharacterized membrane protein YphA (DoxX/SURF4 family)
MGVIFKARGSASFGLLLIRLTIGLIFLISGASKAMDVEGYIIYIKSLNILSENLSFIIGFIIPFAEIFLGALYIIGFLTPFTSLFLGIFTIGALIISGAIPYSDIPFGVPPFSYNFVILACTITTFFSGAGIISFDVFLDKKKIKKDNAPNVKIEADINVKDVQDAEFESIKDEKESKKESGGSENINKKLD